MRYSLLASASLIAIALVGPHSASAEDCGCRDSVRAALTRQAPAAAPARKAKPAPAPRRAARPAMRCTPCAAAAGGGSYDYASARAVDNYPYTHHWQVAPQGYVPPVPYGAPMVPAYDGPADLPPYGPYPPPAYGPMSDLPPSAATAYAAGDDGYGAYAGYAAYAAPAITVDQGGWFGGVGRAYAGVGGGEGGGGGGGGGGGLTLTLSQPDSLNGPSYNSFGQSYGGDYQSANKVNQFRQQAFTPPSNSGSGSGGH